ncbi:Flp family type IVb pilin [Fretibacter rubidus]|uniref:Flp family type IVb pilin n=1 Tax=Fretibacter rubidus TaxID=570162 RepID=UPI00352A704D
MFKILKSFFKNSSGATALEYGLAAALIGVLMVTGVTAVGKQSKAQLSCTSSVVKRADTIKRPERFMENCKRNRSKK